MKILVDMNLSLRWADFLNENGIEAVHWSSIGLPDATDVTSPHLLFFLISSLLPKNITTEYQRVFLLYKGEYYMPAIRNSADLVNNFIKDILHAPMAAENLMKK